MALTNQPYLPLYIDDWMNNTKLKMCTPSAHGVMISIMCIMHKEITYGKILLRQKFKQTDNQIKNFALQIAKVTTFDLLEIENPLSELIAENVLKIQDDFLICNRMVKDAEISNVRSKAGKSGGQANKTKNLSSKKDINFAYTKQEANTQANTVNVNVIENVIENDNNKKEKVPDFFEFLEYAKEQKPLIDEFSVKAKYESWVENNWKDGNNNKIKNWKTKLKNTLPFLKEQNSAQKEKVVAGRQTMSTIQSNLSGWENIK